MIGYPTWMLLLLIAISAAVFDPELSGNVIPMSILAPNPGAADKDRGERENKVDGKAPANEGDGKDSVATSNRPTCSNMPPSIAAGGSTVTVGNNKQQKCLQPSPGGCHWPFLRRTTGSDSSVYSNKCGTTVQLGSESSTIKLFGMLEPKHQFCPITVLIVSPVGRNKSGEITFECEETNKKDSVKWSLFLNSYDLKDMEIERMHYSDDEFASLRKGGPVTCCRIYPTKLYRLNMRSCQKVEVLFDRFDNFKKSVNIPKCSMNFILK